MQRDNGTHPLSGQIDPLQLAEKYGLPLYVYDSSIMRKQWDRINNAYKGPKLKVDYACKALSNINVLKLMNSWGAGLDAVSIQEVKLGLRAGFDPQSIIYTPSGVSLEELDQAVELGVRLNVDNISILEQFGLKYPNYPIGLRINPHIMAGGNEKISVGHVDSKFGISYQQMPHVLRVISATGTRIEGLHMHTGSGILDADVFLQGAEIMFEAAKGFPELDYLDFGGGFKVPYKDGDAETNLEELGPKIAARFMAFCKEYGKELTLVLEPGKFLSSEAGLFLVKVNVIKQTTSTVFACVDSGLNHLIRPMFYNAYHDILNLSNPKGKERLYNVVGYICETDTFATDRKIPQINEGDVLAFKNAGAYCYSMASNYNSRYRPAEVLIHEGKDYLIRERETMEDILRNQVDVQFEEEPVK
ncbi:MAG: diaminopimelate decarboxylase [Bacteroidota bacterium]